MRPAPVQLWVPKAPAPAAPPAGPTVSASGLVHYLDFNGDLQDKSGNGRHWTGVNSPPFVTGPNAANQAVRLTPASFQYLYHGDDPAYDGDGAWTRGGWFATDDLSADSGHWQKITGATGEAQYWESALGGYHRATINTASSGNPSNSGADIPTDLSWVFLVWRRANATANIRVSKNAATPVQLAISDTPTANTADAEIGRKFTTYARWDLARHFYFTRDIPDAEVDELYNLGVALLYSQITWTA